MFFIFVHKSFLEEPHNSESQEEEGRMMLN